MGAQNIGALGVHDLGGQKEDKSIDLACPPLKYWEFQTHALIMALSKKGCFTVDELRRGIEGLPAEAYETLSYYEKWARSAATALTDRGVLTLAEIEAALGEEEEAEPPVKFKKGDLVRVKAENARVRWRKPHLRTPGYIYGLVGEVERDCQGFFTNPERNAFRQPGVKQPMYRVRFRQLDVWEGYTGLPADTLDMEIYQPWLEPANADDLAAQEAATAKRAHVLEHEHTHEHVHAHGHEHGHGHGPIDHGDHTHEARTEVEANAVKLEGDDSERSRLVVALTKVLEEKGIIDPAELRAYIQDMDALGHKPLGPRLVAHAWADPGFKQRLMADAKAAAAEMGVMTGDPDVKTIAGTAAKSAGAMPEGPRPLTGTVLTAVENTPGIHNLVVCTLCSCYPLALLGATPPWYRSRSYRARAVREPRAVLKEFGTVLPEDTVIRVHDSTADLRYIVIPERPAGTEGWSEEELAALVTRDSIIGVEPARGPAAAARETRAAA